MFYRLITQKCNQWIKSPDCPVNYLLDYIATRGMMRDAQVDAIKTYLFLKIAAGNRPLWELFSEGFFNTRTADDLRQPWHSDAEIKIDKLGTVIRDGIKTKDLWDGTLTHDTRPKRIKIRNICGDETVVILSP